MAVLIGAIVAIVVIVIFAIVLVTRYYHRVSPSEVMVIYGREGKDRMLTNGGGWVLPY